jgi:hypothetical protein
MPRSRLLALLLRSAKTDARAGTGAVPLPPMPAAPSRPGVLAAVQYLAPVARGLFARAREQWRLEQANVDDQRSLDGLLLELGRTAREEARHSAPPELAALAAEMRALDTTEVRRARAGEEARAAITRLAEEGERIESSESALRAAVAKQRQAMRELRRKSPERAAAEAELQVLRRRLAEAARENQRSLRERDAELRRWQSEGRDAAAEHVKRQVHVGTLLNLNRIAHPRLDPLYAGIDALKQRLSAREVELDRVRLERTAFDHAAVHNGLLVVAGLVGALVLGALVLLIVLR